MALAAYHCSEVDIPMTLIRWSGLALAIGGAAIIVLDETNLVGSLSPGSYAALAGLMLAAVFFGFLGIHLCQSSHVGRLGLVPIILLGAGTLLSIAAQYAFILPARALGSIAMPFAIVVILVNLIGVFMFGLAMNRGRVLSKNSGTGLILVYSIGVLAGRLLYGLYLAVLGFLILIGKAGRPRAQE